MILHFTIIIVIFILNCVFQMIVMMNSSDSDEESDNKLVCDINGCFVQGNFTFDNSKAFQGGLLDYESTEMSSRNLVRNKRRRWPNSKVPFVLHEYFHLEKNKKHRKAVLDALRSIEEVTCIDFVPVLEPTFQGYLAITPSKRGSCMSTVGYIGKKREIVIMFSKWCLFKPGHILHELIHILGVRHEHTRPDRDNHVIILEKNIARDHLRNFLKSTPEDYTTFGLPYDYSSLMHYRAKSFSSNGGLTIIPKNPRVDPALLGQREKMTQMDAIKLNRLYECRINIKKLSAMKHLLVGRLYENSTWVLHEKKKGQNNRKHHRRNSHEKHSSSKKPKSETIMTITRPHPFNKHWKAIRRHGPHPIRPKTDGIMSIGPLKHNGIMPISHLEHLHKPMKSHALMT